jgi:tetratricopeptide (TPR) repeat protein/tRNA A-37 threonylcarbamoyl transferase component Bud32
MSPDDAADVDESRIQRIVEECEEKLRRGAVVDRDALLAAHPELRPLLDDVLSGLDLVRRAAPALELDRQPADLCSPPIERLGDFVLRHEIGRGGMGYVYEAEQVSLGRRVAVKVLPFFGQIDPKRLRRFRIEVQAAAQLHHTNIVPVHFVGEERGIHYYVMQLIDGQPLSRIIADLRRWEHEKGSTSRIVGLTESSSSTRSREYFQSVARIGIQAARALEHAHAMGIVHRDIKPSNLLLDARGQLWVTDFGLARVESEGSVTRSGEVLGTLRYMSPEQALGRADVDERTDIYSLGVTLAELATLEDLYPGGDREEILRRVTSDDVRRISASGSAVPRDLETVLLECLARSPKERYASAGDLARDLERYIEDRPIAARRPGLLRRTWKWTRRNRALSAALVLAVTLASIGAITSFRRIREARVAEYRELVQSAVMEAQAGLLCARFGPGAYQRGAIHRYFLGLSSSLDGQGPADAAIEKLDRAARLLPDDPAAPYHTARILYLLQRETDSTAALERALAADPGFAPALGLRRWLETQRSTAAPEAASRLPQNEPESAESRLWIEAYRSAAEGRWPAAAQAYSDLSRLSVASAEGYTGSREEILLALGATRLEAGDHFGALEAFAIAEHAWADSITPSLFKAKVLYVLEQDEHAEKTFRALVEKHERSASLVEEIVIFYYLYWDHQKVLTWLQDLTPGYCKEIIEALLRVEVAALGSRSDAGSWWRAAFEAAERASRYRPDSAIAHALSATALMVGFGKLEAGEAAFSRARARWPSDGIVLHYYAGSLNQRRETKQKALETWEEALRLSPWLPYIWGGIANAASELGDQRKSEVAYRRVFELDPADWAGRVYHAIDLRRAGRFDEAERELLEAVRTNSRSAFAWGWLAIHYATSYRGPEALAASERALRLDSQDELASFTAAAVLERLGKPLEAERRFRETAALGGSRRGPSFRRLVGLPPTRDVPWRPWKPRSNCCDSSPTRAAKMPG